jgi:glucose-1-phosphate cytidylyltransferase
MKVVILAGGFGTRLSEETQIIPKPMVEIGGRPILWHIMKIYATYGFNEFVVALGYKSEVIKQYFLDYYFTNSSLSINLATGQAQVHNQDHEDWLIHLVDTGLQTQTGGRIKRLEALIGHETFMMTYGDGVSNANITNLVDFHHQHGKLATMTAVRPPSRFGGVDFVGDRVARFLEKPQIGEGWINGGFFVLEPEVFDYIDNDQIAFEREPLERLVRDEQLMAYRHDDFWQCMDTLRDVRLLQDLWLHSKAPWKIWT